MWRRAYSFAFSDQVASVGLARSARKRPQSAQGQGQEAASEIRGRWGERAGIVQDVGHACAAQGVPAGAVARGRREGESDRKQPLGGTGSERAGEEALRGCASVELPEDAEHDLHLRCPSPAVELAVGEDFGSSRRDLASLTFHERPRERHRLPMAAGPRQCLHRCRRTIGREQGGCRDRIEVPVPAEELACRQGEESFDELGHPEADQAREHPAVDRVGIAHPRSTSTAPRAHPTPANG